MDNKILSVLVIVILLVGIFSVFATVVYAKGSNFLCHKKNDLIIVLKNDANLDKAKFEISKISHVKITKIQDRNKEWSKMVNKMDLPRMENPFKNEVTIKTNKKADLDEIRNKIKEMDFVEDIKNISESDNNK